MHFVKSIEGSYCSVAKELEQLTKMHNRICLEHDALKKKELSFEMAMSENKVLKTEMDNAKSERNKLSQ